RRPLLSLDGSDPEPLPCRASADGIPTSRSDLRLASHVRCDHCRLGVQVFLQPPTSQRARPDSADSRCYTAQPIISFRARRDGRGCCNRTGVFLSERGTVVSMACGGSGSITIV